MDVIVRSRMLSHEQQGPGPGNSLTLLAAIALNRGCSPGAKYFFGRSVAPPCEKVNFVF